MSEMPETELSEKEEPTAKSGFRDKSALDNGLSWPCYGYM